MRLFRRGKPVRTDSHELSARARAAHARGKTFSIGWVYLYGLHDSLRWFLDRDGTGESDPEDIPRGKAILAQITEAAVRITAERTHAAFALTVAGEQLIVAAAADADTVACALRGFAVELLREHARIVPGAQPLNVRGAVVDPDATMVTDTKSRADIDTVSAMMWVAEREARALRTAGIRTFSSRRPFLRIRRSR